MTTLAEAQELLRGQVDQGARCPCCTQYAKVYRRKINSGMAHALIIMFRHARRDWFKMPDISDRWQSRDEAILAYWGLIVESLDKRDDGGRAGWWQITDVGERFVLDQMRLPKYARIYDGRCLGLVGEPQGIRDALGTKFNYRDLMDGI